jgi:ElaB/YqjD/DUF883 family membrane-anchored ribosome-binding protein
MDQRTGSVDDIRRDIEQTRESMTDKMERIESRVDDKVNDVRRTIDLRAQVGAHPWLAVGAAMAAGFVWGRIEDRDRAIDLTAMWSDGNGHRAQPAGPAARRSAAGGAGDKLVGQFQKEVDTVMAAAVGMVGNMVQDWVANAVPQFQEEFQRARQTYGTQRAAT